MKSDSTTNIPVKVGQEQMIEGTNPVVILGANGSGKTRYGIQLASWNNADIIAALRNIELATDIPMQSLLQAEKQLESQKQQRRSRPWGISNEINNLFAKLMAEDSAAAIRFRNGFSADHTCKPETTKLMRLTSVWESLFPGRHIAFEGYVPTVISEYVTSEKGYAAQQMSDGERVALYLAGRVLDSKASVILVDEPEVHFHSRLAVLFWDALERIRSDCRFVYITHDLAFARSRQTSQFLIVRPGQEPELVDLASGIPSDIAESILSAASFSIFADTFVFCEGGESSLDQRLLRSWYKDRTVAVVPVGSCRDVIRCTTTFKSNRILSNVKAIGIVDRDYWPDKLLCALPEGVFALPFQEIESLCCVRNLFLVIAAHVGKSENEANNLYDRFLEEARARFSDGLFLKQVSERFRSRCEEQARISLSVLSVNGSEEEVKKSHCEMLSPQQWNVQPEDIFSEELETMRAAREAGESEFLRYFPGKVYFPILADKLGMSREAYVNLIVGALNASEKSPLASIKERMRKALIGYLPMIRSQSGADDNSGVNKALYEKSQV